MSVTCSHKRTYFDTKLGPAMDTVDELCRVECSMSCYLKSTSARDYTAILNGILDSPQPIVNRILDLSYGVLVRTCGMGGRWETKTKT